jgi:hypothetical protein
MLKAIMAAFALGLLGYISSAGAQDSEQRAMTRVVITTEPALASGCAPMGTVHDDSMKDLRRKIVRRGGNIGVLSFRVDDLEIMQAEVFQCAQLPPGPGIGPPPPPPPPPPRSP